MKGSPPRLTGRPTLQPRSGWVDVAIPVMFHHETLGLPRFARNDNMGCASLSLRGPRFIGGIVNPSGVPSETAIKGSPEGSPLWRGFGGVPQIQHPRAGGWENFVCFAYGWQPNMPLSVGTTDDENVACLHRPCLSVLWKQETGDRWAWIPACAGMTGVLSLSRYIQALFSWQRRQG